MKTNPAKPWKVVEVPTPLGVMHDIKGRLVGEFEKKEDAEESAYLEYVDEPAPDKEDYYSLKVIHCDR
jgi:hypothetical protein